MGLPHGKAADRLTNFESPSLPAGVDRFDQAFEELLRGPAGAELRRAHILGQLATRVFDGDYQRAREALESPHPLLGYRSAAEAAETHEGMIEVKRLLAKNDKPKAEGIGAFLQSCAEGWRREVEPLLDLLPAAWGLSAEQFALLLGAQAPSPLDWQQKSVELDDALRSRLARLRRLHEAFRAVVRPEYYGEIWHSTWERGSPIGERSLWQAYEEDGDPALDVMEARFRAMAGPF